jgi:hypothetical protein
MMYQCQALVEFIVLFFSAFSHRKRPGAESAGPISLGGD